LQLLGLRLIRPEFDLEAIGRWLDSRPSDGPPPPLRLPQLDAPFSIQDGIVQARDWRVSDLQLVLASLHVNAATTLNLAGRIERGDMDTAFDVRIATTPRDDSGALRLDPLQYDLHEQGNDTAWMSVSGSADLDPPKRIAFDLQGHLPHWPETWPALPLPEPDDEALLEFTVGFQGAVPPDGQFEFSLQRGDDSLRGRIRGGDVAAWLARDTPRGLPPLQGFVETERLQLESMELSGLRLSIEDDAPATDAPDDARR
jgi:hypothetical protein